MMNYVDDKKILLIIKVKKKSLFLMKIFYVSPFVDNMLTSKKNFDTDLSP